MLLLWQTGKPAAVAADGGWMRRQMHWWWQCRWSIARLWQNYSVHLTECISGQTSKSTMLPWHVESCQNARLCSSESVLFLLKTTINNSRPESKFGFNIEQRLLLDLLNHSSMKNPYQRAFTKQCCLFCTWSTNRDKFCHTSNTVNWFTLLWYEQSLTLDKNIFIPSVGV